VGLTVSLFTFLLYKGYLNFFAYGFSSVTSLITYHGNRKYKDLHDYNERKKEKRDGKSLYFLSYLTVTVICAIALLILMLIYKV